MNVLVESTLNLMRCAKKNYMSMRHASMLAVAHAHRATERTGITGIAVSAIPICDKKFPKRLSERVV